MKGKWYTTEDKIRILREADLGERTIQAICQEANISEPFASARAVIFFAPIQALADRRPCRKYCDMMRPQILLKCDMSP